MKFFAQLALIGVALIWGWTFVLVKESLMEIGTFAFLFYRFVLAFLLLMAIFGSRLRRVDRRVYGKGCLIGLSLFSGYCFQTLGLNYTTATNSAFITGLSVVLVPVINAMMFRRRVSKIIWFGAFLSAIGLAFIVFRSGHDLFSFNRGDFLTIFCAISFALHIVLISRFTRHHNYAPILIAQISVAMVFSGVGMLAFEELILVSSWLVWKGILVTGIFATALAFWVQNRFQPLSTAARTAIIFSSEPVFAGLFGYLFLRERLTGWQWLGAVFILMAMLMTQLPSKRDKGVKRVTSCPLHLV